MNKRYRGWVATKDRKPYAVNGKVRYSSAWFDTRALAEAWNVAVCEIDPRLEYDKVETQMIVRAI